MYTPVPPLSVLVPPPLHRSNSHELVCHLTQESEYYCEAFLGDVIERDSHPNDFNWPVNAGLCQLGYCLVQ